MDEAETILLANFMQSLMDHAPVQKLSSDDLNSPTEAMLTDSIEVIVDDKELDGNRNDFVLPKGPINEEAVHMLIKLFKGDGKGNIGKLSLKSAQSILKAVYKTVKTLPNTTHVSFSAGEKCNVIGDIHGQLFDLFHILEESGLPSAQNKYVFNGDFVDRGFNGIEVILILLALYAAYPEYVHLNRGNHEDKAICAVYGFQKECEQKYNNLLYVMFCEIFSHLPLCTIINNDVFVIHGGLFHNPDTRLDDIDRITRTVYKAEREDPANRSKDPDGFYLRRLQQDALWSDPHLEDRVIDSKRGAGVMFGPSHAERFLLNNNLKMVIRSHECVNEGFEAPFKAMRCNNPDSLVTIFSASNYGGCGNQAAYMVLYCHAVQGATAIRNSNLYFSVYQFTTSQESTQFIGQTTTILLQDLIRKKWNSIRQKCQAADVDNTGAISKLKWSEIMRDVTNVHILWLPMVSVLCPPDSVRQDSILYMKFLDSFKVGEAGDAMAIHALYAQKRKLESIFRFFDKDGNGSISFDEFRMGCEVMNSILPPEQHLGDPDSLLKMMDFDGSNSIDMNEFFEVCSLIHSLTGSYRYI